MSVRPRSTHHFAVVFVLAVGAGLILGGCGGDSGTSPDDSDEETPRVLDVELDRTSGEPAGRIAIEGIPEDVEAAYGFVTLPGAVRRDSGPARADVVEPFGIAFIRRDDAGDSLVVPLHPVDPMTGGTVEIEITNGSTLTSNRVTLEVEGLEPAPGAYASMVADLQTLHDAWIAHHGTTKEALRATTADQLTPIELQLLLFHGIIDHPDNPNSLAAFAAGDVPLAGDGVVERDVLDALTALSGVDGFIASQAALVDTLTPPAPAAQSYARTFSRRMPDRRLECIEAPNFGIGSDNCFELAEVMAYRAELDFEENSAVQQLQDDAIDVVSTALGYTRGAVVAWGIANTAWAADNIQAGSRGVYPSQFVSEATDFTANPEVIPEDFTSPGQWSEFRVTAASEGWRFDDVVKDAFDRAKGLKGGLDGSTVDDLIGDAANGQGVEDAVGMMEESVKNAAWQKAALELGLEDLTRLEYCPQTWPNIDCTGLPFSEGSSPDLQVDSEALTYEPDRVGSSTLQVQTTDIFGLVTPTAETKTIDTRRIEVFIDPFQATANTDETVNFSVRVENAENEEVEWYPGEGGSLPQDFRPDGSTLAVTTPSEEWDPPILVKARSLADTGLREGKVNSDPREDEAPIAYEDGGVTVSPAFVCLTPDEPQTFAAVVTGLENQEVRWSWEGVGSMSGATYTAPSTAGGEAVIIATSVENTDLKGYAQVVVAGCRCAFGATVSGDVSNAWSGDFAVWSSGQGGGTSLQFTPGGTSSVPILTGSLGTDISGGVTGSFDMMNVQYFDGTAEGSFIAPVEGEQPPRLVIVENDGVTIEGTLSGVLGAGTLAEPRLVTLNVNFKATEIMSNGGSPCSEQ